MCALLICSKRGSHSTFKGRKGDSRDKLYCCCQLPFNQSNPPFRRLELFAYSRALGYSSLSSIARVRNSFALAPLASRSCACSRRTCFSDVLLLFQNIPLPIGCAPKSSRKIEPPYHRVFQTCGPSATAGTKEAQHAFRAFWVPLLARFPWSRMGDYQGLSELGARHELVKCHPSAVSHC